MFRSYKTELNPTPYQINHFRKCAGIHRFVYNWGLAYCINMYEKEKTYIGYYRLNKYFNLIKHTEFPFIAECARDVTQEALLNLDVAYKNFFNSVTGKRKGIAVGVPRFKKKSDGRRFKFNQNINVSTDSIKFPIIGWIRLKEHNYIPTDQRIKSATVSERAGRWFVSILIETDEVEPVPKTVVNKVLGIDLGINHLAVVSDGHQSYYYDNIRPYKKNEKRLKRLGKELSRKKFGPKNREKAKLKLARMHYRISCVREDRLHKVSTELINLEPDMIVFETLKVSAMMKTRLAKSVADAGLAMFKSMVQYKAKHAGIHVINVSQWYPSTQNCSFCGTKNVIPRGTKTFSCCNCKFTIHRDLNAAINIRQEGIRLVS